MYVLLSAFVYVYVLRSVRAKVNAYLCCSYLVFGKAIKYVYVLRSARAKVIVDVLLLAFGKTDVGIVYVLLPGLVRVNLLNFLFFVFFNNNMIEWYE